MEINFAVFINIHLIDYVVDHAFELLVLVTVVLFFQGSLKILWCYHTVTVGVKVSEHISQFLLALNVFHFSSLANKNTSP